MNFIKIIKEKKGILTKLSRKKRNFDKIFKRKKKGILEIKKEGILQFKKGIPSGPEINLDTNLDTNLNKHHKL